MKKYPLNPIINVGLEGNIVFYAVDDEIRIRSYAIPKDPKTPKQLANRKLHAKLNRISAQTKELRQFCYKDIPSYKNSHNAFIGLHKQFICSANLTSEEIYQNIHWSAGNRSGVDSICINREESHCILKWSPGRLNRKSDQYSKAIWVIRNLTQGYWEWDINAGIRKDREAALKVNQASWKDEWLLWLFFYDPTIKKFTVDRQMHVPQGIKSISKQYEKHEPTNWDLFNCIVEKVINTRTKS